VTQHIDVQLDACKALCEGAVDEEAFFLSLSKVRLVALTKKGGGTRTIKPAWVPLILDDVVDSSGTTVTLISKVAALRAKQLQATEFERNCAGSEAQHRPRSGRLSGLSAPSRRSTDPRRKSEPAGARQTPGLRRTGAPTVTPKVP
jgi:hypothetical protein